MYIHFHKKCLILKQGAINLDLFFYIYPIFYVIIFNKAIPDSLYRGLYLTKDAYASLLEVLLLPQRWPSYKMI